jgi:hypothetical protein
MRKPRDALNVTRLPARDLPTDPAEVIQAGERLSVPDADDTVTAITFRRRPPRRLGSPAQWPS